jgi:DNA (cytosine-5)-methyltransferase 1
MGEAIGTQPGDVSHGMVMPFIIKEEHSQNLENAKSVTDHLHTQTTRQSMAVLTTPWIIEMNRTGKCKPANEATGTFTSGGINHAILSAPFIVNNHHSSKADDILRAIGTQCTNDKYGLLTNEAFHSFINHVYGNSYISRMNQPIGAARTKHGHELISFKEPKLEDCFYRMLKSPEVGRAMAFGDDYIVLGTERDKVKQYGNAVTPPAMKLLLRRGLKSLN